MYKYLFESLLKHTCTQIFTVASLTMGEVETTMCPWTGEWVSAMQSIPTVGGHAASASACMDLEDVEFSDRGWTQKDRHCMILLREVP